jgi:hypothetical protein
VVAQTAEMEAGVERIDLVDVPVGGGFEGGRFARLRTFFRFNLRMLIEIIEKLEQFERAYDAASVSTSTSSSSPSVSVSKASMSARISSSVRSGCG